MLSDRINVLIDDAIYLEHAWDPPRDYLGASIAGHACDRCVQYHHLVSIKQIPEVMPEPRTRRIFERGHFLEACAKKWLADAGFVFYPTPAEVSDFDGKFKGHVDGVIFDFKGGNCPIPLPCLWEHKGLGAKGWKAIIKDGLKNYSSTYWGQIHSYMQHLELPNCLYTITNGDSLELHHDLYSFDPTEADAVRAKVSRVLTATDMGELLPRISQDPAFYLCAWCQFRKECWK